MSAVLEIIDDTEDAPQFFAPVSSDVIDGLLGQYESMLARIDKIAAALMQEQDAVRYFLMGSSDRREYSAEGALTRLLQRDAAVKALDASYWSKALALTDVYECMPKARRDVWDKDVREMTTPPFTENAVRPTMLGLLQAREKFFAERVDGIFRGLSGEHVTNCPEAFGKRMILAHIFNEWGTTDHSRAGLVHDFRVVVAKFMGREGQPGWGGTDALLKQAKHQRGEWLSCDGGSWRLRCYKVGTAHIEVHPDMAWRLNCVLAQLHPLAIPAQFRQKPKKKLRDFEMVGQPLPFGVIEQLAGMEEAREFVPHPQRSWDKVARRIPKTRKFHYSLADTHGAVKVLQSIGAVKAEKQDYYVFDYEPADVLAEIVASGCVPDRYTHQFYATPESIAVVCAELAYIGPDDTVLEPSAGQGGLAAFLPKDRTTCVEISPLHCAILKAKGHNTVQADFMEWAETAPKVDRIVMNPPFSQGRWQAHTVAAGGLLKPAGRLVAVLPASAKGKEILPGFVHEWAGPIDNEFAGTSVSVVILKATCS